jgi:hypothetical protein
MSTISNPFWNIIKEHEQRVNAVEELFDRLSISRESLRGRRVIDMEYLYHILMDDEKLAKLVSTMRAKALW